MLPDAEVTSVDMVDGVDPTGSEGVVAACVDKVECTEDALQEKRSSLTVFHRQDKGYLSR